MRIRCLAVDGYRHFSNQEILLEENTTVLAGANNSGKTSLIDLLTVMLQSGNDFGVDDFSAIARHEWSINLLQRLFEGSKFAETLLDEHFEASTPRIEALLEVTYDKKKDDIREFADFLMDLNLEKSSFYFVYSFSPRADKLRASLDGIEKDLREEIKSKKWATLPEAGVGLRTVRTFQEKLCHALFESSSIEVYFSDSTYKHRIKVDRRRFQSLFNVHLVQASRPLDDTIGDKTGELSRRFIKAMKGDEAWEEVIKTLPAGVITAIESSGVSNKATDAAVKSLNTTISSISETNGRSKANLFLDFQLTDKDALQLVAKAIQARYHGGGVPLGERSQGLGYSNLIILHLEVEAFLRDAMRPENEFLVNLVIVEEPESHMHPQMQNAFIKHLFKRVSESKRFQALATTHSNEIVRSSKIEYLRVLKVLDDGVNIIDLKKFHAENVASGTVEDQRLFSLLYEINFADVLFADKVVMYEGDTERMYFQALIRESDALSRLRTQYVSYVQVGGAHAHIYLPLIVDTLKTKTVIITDIDYEKESVTTSEEEIAALDSSNPTLNLLFSPKGSGMSSEDEDAPKRNPKLGELFASKDAEQGVALFTDRQAFAVSFQGKSEGFARTLEEALLFKLTGMEVWESKGREWWKTFRTDSNLSFSIPNSEQEMTIRQIVASTSGKKTDFMYSLIIKKDFQDQTPDYIFSALKWLSDD